MKHDDDNDKNDQNDQNDENDQNGENQEQFAMLFLSAIESVNDQTYSTVFRGIHIDFKCI